MHSNAHCYIRVTPSNAIAIMARTAQKALGCNSTGALRASRSDGQDEESSNRSRFTGRWRHHVLNPNCPIGASLKPM